MCVYACVCVCVSELSSVSYLPSSWIFIKNCCWAAKAKINSVNGLAKGRPRQGRAQGRGAELRNLYGCLH